MRSLIMGPAPFKTQADLLLWWGLDMRHKNRLWPILITCEIILPRGVTREDVRKDELNFFIIISLTILCFQCQMWKHLHFRPFQWMYFCIHTSRPSSVMVWRCLESDLGYLANEKWANGVSLKDNSIWFRFNHLIYLFPKAQCTDWIGWCC